MRVPLAFHNAVPPLADSSGRLENGPGRQCTIFPSARDQKYTTRVVESGSRLQQYRTPLVAPESWSFRVAAHRPRGHLGTLALRGVAALCFGRYRKSVRSRLAVGTAATVPPTSTRRRRSFRGHRGRMNVVRRECGAWAPFRILRNEFHRLGRHS